MIARFLAPYAVPLFGALLFALIAACGALYLSITSHAETKAALNAARAYIEASKEVRDAQETVPDDPADLVKWLHDFAER